MAKIKALIAISGGPDSIYMFEKYKNKFNFTICHINYKKRDSSNRDANIVKQLAKKNNLKYFELVCTDLIYKKYNHIKNFQSQARKIRFDFFSKVSKLEGINLIFIGHHRDDFIETALMQEERSSDYFYYGLKKYSYNNNLELYRPLLKLYKNDIVEYLDNMNIEYGIDESNVEEIYKRNRIRNKLIHINEKDKNKFYKYFMKINKTNEKLNKKIDRFFNEWEISNFDIHVFSKFENEYKEKLIFKFLIEQEGDFKISKNKILEIINYINSNKGKLYRISKELNISIVNRKLIIV